MRQKVFAQVRKCDKCRRAKYDRHKPYGLLHANTAPSKPWEVVSMDFIGPLPTSQGPDGVEFENILVVVDRLTKYAIFTPLPRSYDTPLSCRSFHHRSHRETRNPRDDYLRPR
jgi:hypothetical protein